MRLGWGRRIDQVPDRLRLHQIELPVQHRSAGELTWRSGPSASGVKGRQEPAGNEEPAMTGELD